MLWPIPHALGGLLAGHALRRTPRRTNAGEVRAAFARGRAARRPRVAPHPALGELRSDEIRVLHSRRAGCSLATRVGWSGAQPWWLGRLRREGPLSPTREEEGMAPVEELRGAGQQERSHADG